MERRTLIEGILLGSGVIIVFHAARERRCSDREAKQNALWRLQSANAFFPEATFARTGDLLYQLGIASQLGLTACLVAIGWTDDECRRRIGQDVRKALFFANAGGLGYYSERFARLVPSLSPYGRLRFPLPVGAPIIGTIDSDEAKRAVSDLLASVRLHLVRLGRNGSRT